MDPINILIAINIVATFAANIGAAKKGVKDKLAVFRDKPKTYLQTLPLVISTVNLLILILAVFQIGTLDYEQNFFSLRVISLIVYLIFSWIQIWSFKTLGEYYSQEIAVRKEHKIISAGPYKIIRHPQYLSQIFVDLAGALATLSYILFPLALIQIPFLILRAKEEEKLFKKYLSEEFESYKKQSGFMIPFIG
ncbi:MULTISPECIES: isoprenylcysteine carboxylmethyltransferase family protein [Ignavibacterium]|jgi:protein-S-isoprenylcysteine O-methyltransferase Ste14|uniref:methyltransferase family protein n=1 Tax=Ignavibacterium TaxID=795750 RepID=UPI0025C6443F|nr:MULTISPECIES: isoprenylcysteine carboxylmethyltransferase family protein [Ignavibacterium]MBI5661863.1 isoprenylcysteine carboxylmethyltransferase family protein [Ignavibacterium album]